MAIGKNQRGKIDSDIKVHSISEVDREKIKKIAEKVKKLRVKAGFSSYEGFALHAGINRNSYFRFERSAITGDNYTVALLIKIARGLNISLSDFFQDFN
jgi:transcriptional regulator with XRE-family HTH domain